MSFCLWNHFGCVCEWSHTALQASCSQSGSHKMNLRSQDKVEINKAQHLLCIYLFVWTFILFLWWNTAQNIHYCHMQSCVIQRSEMYYMDLIPPWGAVENEHLGTSSSSSSSPSSSRGGGGQENWTCSCFTLNNHRRGYPSQFISSQLQFVMRRQKIFWYWKHS